MSSSSASLCVLWSGLLALSSSSMARVRLSGWVTNGCCKNRSDAMKHYWTMLDQWIQSYMFSEGRADLTCRSLSAVGLFLGFLVKAIFTKWWKLFVLHEPKQTRWEWKNLTNIWMCRSSIKTLIMLQNCFSKKYCWTFYSIKNPTKNVSWFSQKH